VLCDAKSAMRILDMKGMMIVHSGCVWPYKNIDPSSKAAMGKLERNESVITWVQPVDGSIEDQLPVINVDEKGFYMLSLRCMKVVFRHVRLRKGFTNREYTSCGRLKLRIPMSLMREKVRTQSRFTVRVSPAKSMWVY